jgi:hypothetical protein
MTDKSLFEHGTLKGVKEKNGITEIVLSEGFSNLRILRFQEELPIKISFKKDRIWYCTSGLVNLYRSPHFESWNGDKNSSLIRTISNLNSTLLVPGNAVYIKQFEAYSARNINAYSSEILEIIPGVETNLEEEVFYPSKKLSNLLGVERGLSLPELIKECRSKIKE